ncbi:hypothetical protein [Streptomyces yokosukanensis]|nr:hypothetical protein [Streptomyces yokosukanensis]
MRWPIVSRRRYETDLAAAKAETDRQRELRVKAEKGEATARFNRQQVLEQNASLDEKYADVCIVNEHLTDDLTKARERIAQYGVRRTVPDVLEEHDVHRKALADALGPQKRHLNWDQLIAEAARLNAAATEWMTECQAHATRADRLQRRLDDSLGLNTSQVEDGRYWQQTRHDTKGVAL